MDVNHDSGATIVMTLPEALRIYILGLVAWTAAAMLLLILRVAARRSRIAKTAALGDGLLFPILLWSIGALGYLGIGLGFDAWGGPFLIYLAAAGAAQLVHVGVRHQLRRHIATYSRPCPQCRRPMGLFAADAAAPHLTAQQQLESAAGGMQFEVWHCAGCAQTDVQGIPDHRAERCRKCGWRTAALSEFVVVAATETKAGKKRVTATCSNPACGYQVSRDARIAATGTGVSETTILDRKTDSDHGGGSDTPSSGFGGGSSGGAGSTRGW